MIEGENNIYLKYKMKRLRIKKIDASEFSIHQYIHLEKEFQARNFQTAYFLQIRVLGFWVTLQKYISEDSSYALLCASEAMNKLQEKI